MAKRNNVSTYTIIILILAFSCREKDLKNNSPNIISLDPSSEWTKPGEKITIICLANDPEGNSMTFDWDSSDGELDAKENTAQWIAPSHGGIFEISCIVTDERGGESQKYVNIKVIENPFTINDVGNLNIIVITADDLGKQLSCYGDKYIQTPNIDFLATNGLKFENSYVTQSSCSPSRSSILTGLYPHSNGQIGLIGGGFHLNNTYPNLAQTLREHGYVNGKIGKLHVEPRDIFPFDFKVNNAPRTREIKFVASKAKSFIESTNGKPFFLYINYFDPHVPFEEDVKGFPTEKLTSSDIGAFDFQGINDPSELNRIAAYYNCVKRLDEGVGLLIETFRELDVMDNSLIFFVGDNGPPFARAKAASYEASINTPLIISLPPNLAKNKSVGSLVSTIDIYPTVLDALGIEISNTLQGKSIVPLFVDSQLEVRKHLFTEFTYHGGGIENYYPRRTVRNKQFKLIRNLAYDLINNAKLNIDGDSSYYFSLNEKYHDTWVNEIFQRLKKPPLHELYDLINDPHEKVNLSGNPDYSIVENELSDQLTIWMTETNDQYLDKNYIISEIERLDK